MPSAAVPRKKRNEINTLIILMATSISLERNGRVLNKFATALMEVCRKIKADFELWKKAKLCGNQGEIW
jgi:hypothetical protein